MRLFTYLISFFWSLSSFGQLNDSQIRELKSGRIIDDSSYVYSLPYEKGSAYLFIQGANSSMSHKSELSFDFKMKPGSKICAVRDGKVIQVKSNSNTGGLKPEFMNDGNHIIIVHEDGSVAQYWHLQKGGVYVTIGEKVKKGQVIGASGNTGYTAFPHLHFQVIDKNSKEILPRFLTKKGAKYLRPGRWYKNI